MLDGGDDVVHVPGQHLLDWTRAVPESAAGHRRAGDPVRGRRIAMSGPSGSGMGRQASFGGLALGLRAGCGGQFHRLLHLPVIPWDSGSCRGSSAGPADAT